MFIEKIKPIQLSTQITESNKVLDKSKGDLSFKSIFEDAFENYVEAENKVEEDIYKLSTGESDDLHNLMINTQQAQVSLDLMIQLRNKALDAYNEIMRMGV